MKKIIFLIPIISVLICFFALLNTDFVLAEEEPGYEINVTIPRGPTAGTEVALDEYIKYIYLFGLSFIGIVALGVLVYGGFLYMMSDTVVSKDDAKKYIWAAIAGLLLGLCAFLILNTINPELTSLSLPEMQSPKEPTGTSTPTFCESNSECDSSKCEICVDKGGESKRCFDTCSIKECKTCNGGSCENDEDGTKCSIGICEGGKCKDNSNLKEEGSYCERNTECQSGICYNSQCVGEKPAEECIEDGKACVTDDSCCSKTCSNGKCADCKENGSLCTDNSQCCDGYCDMSGSDWVCKEQAGN